MVSVIEHGSFDGGYMTVLECVIGERDRMRAMLKRLEWIEVENGNMLHEQCDLCRAARYDGHAPGCDLAALLGDAA